MHRADIPVTVIVPVKNEEANLAACLEKLHDFSEVIVVDSNSTDNTPQVAKAFGCQLVNFNWNGQFPKKRNWTLQHIPIKHDWVLFLDADEFLTPSFIEALRQKIQAPDIAGYWLYYDNYFMNKRLRYGDKMKKLALFKKSLGAYERIDEDAWSHLDMEVHEHPIIKGKTGSIRQPIIHKDYKGLAHYKAKHEAYADWEAKRYMDLKDKGFKDLNGRQKLKYKLIKLGILPMIYFLGTYILKGGFLDGRPGFVFAQYKARYFNNIQHKIKELKKTQI